METLKFTTKFKGKVVMSNQKCGDAVIVSSYSAGVEAATAFFQDFENANFKTKELMNFEGYTIFENYVDSGSVDYFYFAIEK